MNYTVTSVHVLCQVLNHQMSSCHCGFLSNRWFCLQVNIDFEKEPIGVGKDGQNVFLRDIWPTNDEVAAVRHHDCFFISDLDYLSHVIVQ